MRLARCVLGLWRRSTPPGFVGMVLDQVCTQVRRLEAQEDAETEEKKEEDNGALQSAG